MCTNNFSEAYQNFKQAVDADPTNTSVSISPCILFFLSPMLLQRVINSFVCPSVTKI